MSEQFELEINTLGGLRITLGGKPLTGIGSRKAEALLLYLACSRRPQPREVLADLFWDERTSPQALSNLRWLLSRLTQSVAPYLVVTRTLVGMNPHARYRLDVTDFEDTLQQARASGPRGDSLSQRAVRLLEEAVTLYGGNFLQGFFVREAYGFEEWTLREQERLHHLATLALSDLVDYYKEHGSRDAGVRCATRLVELNPLDPKVRHDLEALLAHDERNRPLHLPISLTPFVGRESELSEIGQYLAEPECRLLTLVGPGGAGKTRLAIEAARATSGFPDGVYFAALDAVSGPEFVASAVAGALQLTLSGGKRPLEQLADYMAEKKVLLVLDNFDHLLAGAGILAELLVRAPGVKLLVTSRQPVDLAAEQVYDVEGLQFPPDAFHATARIESYDSVRLFVQRARRVRPRFNLTAGDAQYVARICRTLEGLPLAIELTAIWVREHTCQEIEERLEQGISLLATSRHDVPTRHSSLRAVFDEAWGLLTGEEGRVLARISVFRGGFDEGAALKVAGADRVLLIKLVERSLLRQMAGGRYSVHEMLRQYASTRLNEQPGERESAEAEHTAFYAALASSAFPELVGTQQLAWLGRLEVEHDNIRAALNRVLEKQDAHMGLQMTRVLQRFWYFRGYLREGLRWMEAALALPTAQVNLEALGETQGAERELALARAKAANGAGVLCQDMAEREKAEGFVSESVAIFRALGETLMLASPLNNLGLLARDSGDLTRARTLLEESLSLYREQGDSQSVAVVLNNLGKVTLWLGDNAQARALLEESLALFEERGEMRGIALAQTNLAQVARNEGDDTQALVLFGESLKLYIEVGDKRGEAECLEGIAEACAISAVEQQEKLAASDNTSVWERVAVILAGAEALRATIGARLSQTDSRHVDKCIAATRANLTRERWAACRAIGVALTHEQLIAYVLETGLCTCESSTKRIAL